MVHVASLPPPAVGTVGEDGPATEAALNNAEDLAVAPNGGIYIADVNSSRLLRIRDGILTVAYRGDFGAGEADFSGVAVGTDGTVYFTTGLAIKSLAPDGTLTDLVTTTDAFQVFGPKLAVAPDGTLLVGSGRLPLLSRVEDDGTTTPIAGSDELATEPGAGDGGPADEARFSSISDLAVDPGQHLSGFEVFDGSADRRPVVEQEAGDLTAVVSGPVVLAGSRVVGDPLAAD